MFSFKRSLIALVGLLVIVATLAALMPLVSRGQGDIKNPFNRDPRKSYYLTQTTHNGSQALTACAAGYHMASLWEIFDPSNLRYDTELGVVVGDSGFGPPSSDGGWVRTGFDSEQSGIGTANCSAWTSASGASGSVVRLDPLWESTIVTPIRPWVALSLSCNVPVKVWCIQD